ncbi:MAG: hypothetical protein EA365_13960 [Gloeocapsa sp. DLM2.Bin57]|nr:MAG: hypothetical protein EA365_13960 [Gloeocapsa sp. DLM2.Bin57]
MKQFFSSLASVFKDRNFLKIIHVIENIVSKVLSLALIFVIFVSLIELIMALLADIDLTNESGLFTKTLIEIFGLFLNILIALELLENITAYLRKHIVQVELVITTALIAVARKIIIFDPKQYDKIDLLSLGFAIIALSGSYGLVKYFNNKNKDKGID